MRSGDEGNEAGSGVSLTAGLCSRRGSQRLEALEGRGLKPQRWLALPCTYTAIYRPDVGQWHAVFRWIKWHITHLSIYSASYSTDSIWGMDTKVPCTPWSPCDFIESNLKMLWNLEYSDHYVWQTMQGGFWGFPFGLHSTLRYSHYFVYLVYTNIALWPIRIILKFKHLLLRYGILSY